MTAPRPDAAPLILTLGLDGRSFAFFDALRRAHFPPERNLIPAHLTLFHNLPACEARGIRAALGEAARATRQVPLRVTGVKGLGRGVAFGIESPALSALRRRLADAFDPWLTPQDRQGFRPHVTVQNKVEPRAAEALRRELLAGFAPFEARGESARRAT